MIPPLAALVTRRQGSFNRADACCAISSRTRRKTAMTSSFEPVALAGSGNPRWTRLPWSEPYWTIFRRPVAHHHHQVKRLLAEHVDGFGTPMIIDSYLRQHTRSADSGNLPAGRLR